MKILTVCNQKGGIAKTTSCWNIAKGLNQRGYSVLLIDADAQCNLSLTCGVDILGDIVTLYDVFKGKARLQDSIYKIDDKLDIVCGSISLASCDMEFTQVGKEYMLRDCVEPIQEDYDYCIIDTPPSLCLMNTNAFVVSDYLLVPMKADIYALQGIAQLHGFVTRIQKYCNSKVQFGGIFCTMVDERANYTKRMLQAIKETADDFGIRLFNTKIRQSVKVGESNLEGKSLFELSPKSKLASDYNSLIDEILEL